MSSASGPSKKRAGPDSPASSGPSGTVRSQTVAEIFETSIHAEDFEACVRLLEEDHSPSTWTGSSHEWIQEVLAMGFTPQEVVDLMIEEKDQSPWICYELGAIIWYELDVHLHQSNCVHTSILQRGDQLPKPLVSMPRDVKQRISEICGLGGIIPCLEAHPYQLISIPMLRSPEYLDWRKDVSFEGSIAYIAYEVDEPLLGLSQCSLILDRIVNLCGWLQQEKWVCNHLVVLKWETGTEIQSRTIAFSLIVQLQECVNESMSSERSSAPNRKNCRMFDTALEILSAEYASISAGYRLENAIDACALAVQTICVSLLTACEAHIGAVRPFFLDRPLTEIFLLGINGAISQSLRLRFHLGDLACFGNMLGQSVMALDSTRCETSVDDYRLVSMPIEHITELWGPSDVIRDQFDPSITYAIRIGGGIIYRPLEDSSVLHWEPWSLRDVAERNPLDISDWLTVGDLTSIKRDCPLVRGPQDTILRSSLRTEVHELGTWKESWTLQQIQTGLQAGQYVNATFNATWIKSASRTRKEKGLAELGLDFLDQPWGLLVSVCTGVSLRVPLREVVAEVIFPMMDAWLDEPAAWYVLNLLVDPHDIHQKMKSSDFRDWVNSLPFDERSAVSRCVTYVLRKICWTGVNNNGKLNSLALARTHGWLRSRSIR